MATITTTAEFDAGADAVLRWGKLFATGNYAAKNFSMTADELKAAVDGFTPVPVDLEHTPTVLSGKLGMVEQVKLSDDGQTLLGAVSEPAWLSTLLGNTPRKVSCTWDRATKQLCGLAYTLDPHIPDAAVFSAYASFASGTHNTSTGQSTIQTMHDIAASSGAVCSQDNPNGTTSGHAYYNSAHENQAMQAMHDTACQHGAKCQDMAAGTSMFAGQRHSAGDLKDLQNIHDLVVKQGATCAPQAKMTKEKPMAEPSLWEQFKRALGGGDEPAAAFTAAVTPTVTSTQPDPEIERLKAENAKKDQELATFKAQQLEKDAIAFADAEIAAHRALPAERTTLIAMFTQAAADDARNPTTVTFGTGQQGSRVDALKAMTQARPSHTLTQELVPRAGMALLTDTPDDLTKLQADVAAFLNQSDLGKASIKK